MQLAPAGICPGRSPRGRGRPHRRPTGSVGDRSIPAWAGETPPIWTCTSSAAVDPRVGGGDDSGHEARFSRDGRSPRGRGRLGAPAGRGPDPRSIPAWAGETPTARRRTARCGVDPRVGGGDARGQGLSWAIRGRSPRGRGRLEPGDGYRYLCRSIPAWAGETQPSTPRASAWAVDPRVGGGDHGLRGLAAWRSGRSPRGRGRRGHPHRGRAPGRSIPAWAGETRSVSPAASS